jgi:outer membrane immunogenic protein
MSLKSFAGAASLAVLAFAANPAAAQPILDDSWSGLYIGGHLGAAFDPNKLNFQDRSTAQDLSFSSPDENSRFIGGVQAGYLWQPGNLVFGVEGDSSWGKNIDYLASVRGVLGVPAGPFLLYGTGGAAFEGAHERFVVFSQSPGIFDFNRDINKDGWVAGAGVQTWVLPAVSVGVEGLYYDMGSDTSALTTVAGTAGEPFSVKDDRRFAVVRARVDYHL